MLIVKGIVAAITVVVVSEMSSRFPRLGALVLSLPLVSVLTFITAWTTKRDLFAISSLARETMIITTLTMVFFAPIAFHDRLGLGFWSAFGSGVVLSVIVIGLWFWIGPTRIL
jgi:hypothetical protein